MKVQLIKIVGSSKKCLKEIYSIEGIHLKKEICVISDLNLNLTQLEKDEQIKRKLSTRR